MSKPNSLSTPAPQRSQHRGLSVRPALRKSAMSTVGRRAPRCLSQCVVRSLRENNRALARERGCHLAEIAQLNQQLRQLQAENLRLQQQLAALKEGAGGQQQLLGGSLFELHSHNVRALDCLYRSVTASQKLLAAVQSEYERPLEASVATIGEQLSVLLTAYTDPFSQRDLIRRSPLRPINQEPAACGQPAATDASSGPPDEASLLLAAPEPKPESAKKRKLEPQTEAKPDVSRAKSAAKRRELAAGRAAETAEDPFSSRPRLPRTSPRPSPVAAQAAGVVQCCGTKRAPAAVAAAAAPPKRRARREVVVDVKVEACAAGDVFEPRSSVADGGLPPTLQGFRDGQQRRRQLPPRGRRAAAK